MRNSTKQNGNQLVVETHSQVTVEMFPGSAGGHPATTHVVEHDVLSQEFSDMAVR